MNKSLIAVLAAVFAVPVVAMAGVLGAFSVLVGGAKQTAVAAIPASVPGLDPQLLKAYVAAAAKTSTVAARCRGMRWQILAGIAQIESNNAAGHSIDPTGNVTPPIIGPTLDGSGAGGNNTAIRDTDNGVWDRDVQYDAAVGVLQFIPSSWRLYGRDGNGDHIADPHNVYDNALAAVVHLCGSTEQDLANPEALRQAIYSYNHSWSYVAKVSDAIASFDAVASPAVGDLPAGSGVGAKLVIAARRYLGTPYSWGGGSLTGPSRGICCSPNGSSGTNIVGFDCSGLTRYAAAQAGITIPRSSQAQANLGNQIPRTAGLRALQPGDLVFFGFVPDARLGIHHVGIYLGNGQMINAPRPGQRVRIEPVWDHEYAGAVRLG